MNFATKELLKIISKREPGATIEQIFDKILCIPVDLAPASYIEQLFGHDYCPGTFLISERKKLPDFLSDNDRLPFNTWVRSIVREHIEQIKSASNIPTKVKRKLDVIGDERLEDLVLEVLEESHPCGLALSEMIWNQEYDDIFRRIEAGFIVGDPEFCFNVYASLKDAQLKIGLYILKQLERNPLPVESMIILSALSGLIGLDHKTSATAASPIVHKNIICISLTPTEDESKSVLSLLQEKADQVPSIDDRDIFIKLIYDTKSQRKVTFILDDFMESLLDIKLAESMLKLNSSLSISIIPRWGFCGNDMSYEECIHLLNLPLYHQLELFCNSSPKRLRIISDGPILGALNGRKISTNVAKALCESDMLYVKGARNYEMMQGVQRDTLYAFSVCREISESLTGVPASSGSPVFIYQPLGKKTFQGFLQRKSRKNETSSGYGLAQMTAKEFVKNRKAEEKT